jgi:hypothetical protein
MVTAQKIIDNIPPAETIRARLTELVREQHALRALLRVAERAEKARAQRRKSSRQQEAANVG